MAVLEVKLLGNPEIVYDGEPVNFPYKKVEALFYYLVVNKEIKRNKAASLLWGDMPEDNARKNLRNALYMLRKIIGKDFINTPDRYTIEFNNKIEVRIDIALFKENNNENSRVLELYKGEFLQDFIISDCLDFTDWVLSQRSFYRNSYINLLEEQIRELKDRSKVEEAVHYLKQLIAVDEFNESAYRDLMEIYYGKGDPGRAINLYRKLKAKLEDELGITPDTATEILFKRIKRDNTVSRNRKEFIGREEELNRLLKSINGFLEGKDTRSSLIIGEAGIGKTALLNKALSYFDTDELLILKVDCYPAEKQYIYKPWKTILEQIKEKIDLIEIDDTLPWKRIISFLFPSFLSEKKVALSDGLLNFESIQHQSAVDALIYLLTEVARKNRLVLVFEDLQWCDSKSLELLKILIHENKNSNILVIASSRNERRERLRGFSAGLNRSGLLQVINLKRLNFEEVKMFISQKAPDHDLSGEFLHEVYRETAGNMFFLTESLKLLSQNRDSKALTDFLTDKSRDILEERVLSVSKEAQKILNIVAIPFDRISFDLLLKLSGKDEFELIDTLEELEDYYLLEEISPLKNGDSYYKFTHIKIRDYIYQKLSRPRRALLHKKIGELLEEGIVAARDKRSYYSRLIYHFKNAGYKPKQLQYLIKEAEIYFHRSHELFPVINDEKLKRDQVIFLNQEESRRYLKEIKELLLKIDAEKNGFVIEEMEVKYLDMKSLFLIGQGDYLAALSVLEEMIEKARSLDDWHSVIEGYQQLAGIGIQEEDIQLIENSGRKMFELAEDRNMIIKMGIALRFQGISDLYNKKYEQAEEKFNRALRLFKRVESDTRKYTLGIAAIYNYLGEIKRHRGDFREALNYYERCIGLCEARNIVCGLGVFYTNAGQIYFELNDYQGAENNFRRAVDIFSQLKTIWGYSTIARSFLALLEVKKGNYHKAYEHIQTADLIISEHHKRYWQGILLRIKAVLAAEMKKNRQLYEIFKNYLTIEEREYARQALKIFKDIGASYEVELMEEVFEFN